MNASNIRILVALKLDNNQIFVYASNARVFLTLKLDS